MSTEDATPPPPSEIDRPTQSFVPEPVEAPNPARALRIRNEYPTAIYGAIEAQMERQLAGGGFSAGLIGETIGFVHSENLVHPLRGVESRVHGNLMPTAWEDDPNHPGSQRATGERRREFDIQTRFQLPNHTFLDENRTTQLIANLQGFGYQSAITEMENGNRNLVIQTPEGSFDLNIGWPSADRQLQYYRQQEEEHKEKYPTLVRGDQKQAQKVIEGQDQSIIALSITSSHPGAPFGIPIESSEQVLRFLESNRVLAEVVGTSLVNVLGGGKRFPELRMDWLPPQVVRQMSTLRSSEVIGKVEPTQMVETKIKEDFGLERLAGLSAETLADLRRIKDRLQNPKKAAFMKKHGFKQSNGGVFFGVPGTGKSLAVEALAEEAGCEREELKIDEYMTAYIHDSAHRLGEKIREIKSKAANQDKPVIVQIDEADTILMPINGGGNISGRDAAEVRAVLLREFQEPSNVFYILTTNLDPRDPRQADPAIVRNQRVGYLVGFGMPSIAGRQEIFEKEMRKRTGDDLKWEGVDYESLGQVTEGFSPADIQEVLSVAAGESYDVDTGAAFVNQQHIEQAVNLIKSRKLMEAEIRRGPLGFSIPSK